MRTLIIPKDGVPFFGEDIPVEKVGERFARLAEPFQVVSARDPIDMLPAYRPVVVNYYDFRFRIADRFKQDRIAVYEQI